MRFTKMHGTGNDYIYVDGFQEDLASCDLAALARELSDRHTGIGGDGIICILPSRVADFRMRMFNADGSEGEMCGNGIRCLAKYVVERGMTDKARIRVETLAGIITNEVVLEGDRVTSVRVDMGPPRLAAADIPVRPEDLGGPGWPWGGFARGLGSRPDAVPKGGRTPLDGGGLAPSGNPGAAGTGPTPGVNPGPNGGEGPGPEPHRKPAGAVLPPGFSVPDAAVIQEPLAVGAEAFRVTCVSMGNPHGVIFVDDAGAVDLARLGPQIERHRAFPSRVNVEFVEVRDPATLRMRVWERGSGITRACGTGACASAVAAALTGRAGRKVTVHVDGGPLEIEWADDGHVYLTGPAEEVFTGVYRRR